MPTIVLPKGLIKILVLAIVGLLLAHLATQVLKYHFGHNYQAGLERLFNLDRENNIPSWYASSALLLCSAFLWLIWQLRQQQADRDARYWMALSLIFLFLSIDEAASIHETLVYHSVLYLLPSLDATGYLLYPWVLAGGVFALIVAFSCHRFLFRLPSKTRWGFVLSGLIYVGGAVGLDLLEGEFEYQHEGREQFPYALLVAVEESLEMLGILLFLYSLCEFMTAAHPAFQVTTRSAVLADECARSRSTVVHMPRPPVVLPEPVPAKEVALQTTDASRDS